MKNNTGIRHGVTLVEMLVALGLSLFVLALFTTLMVSAMGGLTAMKGISAVDSRVRNVLLTLRQDLKNVFVARDGGDLKISELFTEAGRIPSRGYFSLEENSPAIRHGVDQWDNPVELDTDDVLAFTCRLSGLKPEEMFYGKVVYTSNAAAINSDTGQIVNFGKYLDNIQGSPQSRFDIPNNFTFSSRYAEIIYFLRPVNKQHVRDDLAADVSNTSRVEPIFPALYNLHRRVLLVVDNADALNRGSNLSKNGIDLTGVHSAGNFSFYNRFDISASREVEASSTGNANWTFGNTQRLHINSLADLSRREFRYGMRVLRTTNPAFAMNASAPQQTFRAVPLSHANKDHELKAPFVHSYNDANDGGEDMRWFGRPLVMESTHPSYPFWDDDSSNAHSNPPATGPVMLDDTENTNGDGVLDNYTTASTGRRAGDDIVLTNVVSFDVKVLENTNNAISINPMRGYDGGTIAPAQKQGEFVDLGYWSNYYGDGTTGNNDYVGLDQGGSPTGPTEGMAYNWEYDFDSSNPTMAAINTPFGVLIDANAKRGGVESKVPFGTGGQVGTSSASDKNLLNANPRNTYDSWSSSYNYSDPMLRPTPTMPSDPPASTDGWRPVPYPRPLMGLQIKLRIYEPRSGIVREVTIRHAF